MSTTTRIEVVIHPQSVVHSAVRFVDGSVKAQLGTPDMRLPIQYALTYPDRLASPVAAPDLVAAGRLEFRAPRRGPLPGAADRARGRACRVAGDGGPDRRRRGRGRRASSTAASTSRASPRLLEAAVGRFGAGADQTPDLDDLDRARPRGPRRVRRPEGQGRPA